jgi:hypothetical protein
VNARDAVPDPSPEAARAFVDKPFADVPQLPGEPVLPTHVNYNFLNTTEDVKQAMSRLSGLYEQRITEQTRGTVSWEETYQQARALYEQTTGEKLAAAPDGANYRELAADLYAQKQLLISGVEQLMTLRNEYAAARDAGTATPQQQLKLLAQIERVATAQATTRGAQAEVGRALNILKSTNRDKSYYDALNKVIDGRFAIEGKLGDRNFDRMVDLMGDLGSPAEALAFAGRAAKATTWDKIVEAWKSGLVSGPITQIANIMGNATFMATRPLVDLTAAAIGLARSSPDRVTATEPLARVVGNIQGVFDAAKVAASVLRTGGNEAKLETPHREAIGGIAGDVVRVPFRLLSAADAFFRVLNERGETYALSVREAVSEGFNPATREFRARVLELATNPTQGIMDATDAAGTRFTFNTPLGEQGQSIQAAIRKTAQRVDDPPSCRRRPTSPRRCCASRPWPPWSASGAKRSPPAAPRATRPSRKWQRAPRRAWRCSPWPCPATSAARATPTRRSARWRWPPAGSPTPSRWATPGTATGACSPWAPSLACPRTWPTCGST